MVADVRYMGAQVSVFYHHADVLSFDVKEMAKVVSGRYLPPVRIDDRDGNPAQVMVSENGNSQIVVTSSSTALHVTFSPQWQDQPHLGREYLAERVPLLFEVISRNSNNSLIFAGTSVESQISGDLADSTIAAAIEQYYGGRFGSNLTDLFVRTSEAADEDHYRNITVQNFRSFVAGAQTPPQIRLKNATASARGIAVTVEFNSRYGYNEGRNTPVTIESVNRSIDDAYSASADVTTHLLERII